VIEVFFPFLVFFQGPGEIRQTDQELLKCRKLPSERPPDWSVHRAKAARGKALRGRSEAKKFGAACRRHPILGSYLDFEGQILEANQLMPFLHIVGYDHEELVGGPAYGWDGFSRPAGSGAISADTRLIQELKLTPGLFSPCEEGSTQGEKDGRPCSRAADWPFWQKPSRGRAAKNHKVCRLSWLRLNFLTLFFLLTGKRN